MDIKPTIDTLEGVGDDLKPFYAEHDGAFQFDINKYTAARVDEMTSGLKAKNDELLSEKKTVAQKAKEAEEAKAAMEAEAARKNGDTEALEKSWAEKLAKVEATYKEQIEQSNGAIQKLTVGAKAAALAGELAVQGTAPILERFISDRLAVEMTDNGPTVRVLDASGKPSASTLDDLKAELMGDQRFSTLIAGSKATGGGAAGANGGAGTKQITRAQFDAMSANEKPAFFKSGGKVVD